MKIKLPVMQCDDGCGECCGVVMASQKEFDRIGAYARGRGIRPVAQGVTCPWYQGGSCQVYEVRPAACQLYGHTEKMTCPRGYNTNIPERKARRAALRAGPPARLLHEALPDGGDRVLIDMKELLER